MGRGKKGEAMLVVGSKVKAYVNAKKLRCAAEVLGAVNACVRCCLDEAVTRARANGRKTVQAKDV
jgi:histone H3/H4